jgi:hypothetical protein
MKLFTTLLPLVALSSAFVIVEQLDTFPAIENKQDSLYKVPCAKKLWEQFLETSSEAIESTKNAFDDAVEHASEASKNVLDAFDEASDYASKAGSKAVNALEETFDTQAWLDMAEEDLDTQAWLDMAEEDLDLFEDHGRKPRRPPHRKPRRPPHRKPPHHRKPKHPHHGKPNMTIYQLISGSKYTTKLAKLIDEFDDLVQLLNGTAANYTVFAPTDKAFEKIPDKAPKPSKEFLKKLLTYHVSSDFYPARRILATRTIPTLFKGKELGGEPQRLSTNIGFRGLTINFYSRVIAANIVSLS